ncbi:PucR family transcriptional regulator [Candidatus Solirubrobacter pratensis]|uniref:PucR family transcriptional regulator n=1 Tax=Candidatus Solirubrobacter pratensis TaxID=1298857 RepID=UPI0004225925|nr:PucR family transcriptional regulator [Candidatus Solirubrobacter pratensis]
MLLLRELLRELDVKVVAGETGLGRAVRWVHISELPDPTPWLSGGELLLTTGLQLGDADQQREYVARLSTHGLSGLGFGAGFSHEHVPPALEEAAAEHGFPLFEVPYHLPFIAITEKAFTQLVNEQYAVLQRALSAHERLERIVLSERGLDGVASALAAMVGGPALIFDARGHVLARRAGRTALADGVTEALAAELRERTRAGARRGYAPSMEALPRALALPVARTGVREGGGEGPVPEAWLIAAKDAGPLTELDRLTLHQAVTIVALELLRRRVADDTERRLAGDVLTALVAGELGGHDLARRLEPFGLHERAGALVIDPPRSVRSTVEDALARAVREEAGGGLVAPAGRFLCALLPAGADDELFDLAERLRARVSREAGVELSAGAGRSVAPSELRRGFHEARCALEARELALNGDVDGRGALATYRDLGSFQLLLSLQDDDALRLFCDSILAPIEDSEGTYGGELMRSLEAFIECNGQWERAARALYCHRHTLRYRIRRVEELTGRSLDSARDRIDFWLALRGREIVKPFRPPSSQVRTSGDVTERNFQ